MTWLISEVIGGGPRVRFSDLSSNLMSLLPGLLIAGLIAVFAYGFEEIQWQVTRHRVFEALVVAMLLGFLLRNTLHVSGAVEPGAAFVSKSVLEMAVALFGVGLDVQSVTGAGLKLVIAIFLGVVIGMCISFAVGKGLGLQSKMAYLIAVGNAICGNSAIAAVAPVVKAERHEIASAIGLTAIAGVIVVLVLPLVIPVFNLGDYQYGIIAGMAVYAVPQVVAAAFAVSHVSGEIATLVKLTRVMFLGPLMLATGIYMHKSGERAHKIRRQELLPAFVAGFFALMIIRSLGIIPLEVVNIMRDVARALTIWAMAGLGLGVELSAMRAVGLRVGATTVISMTSVLLVSIGLVLGLGLND